MSDVNPFPTFAMFQNAMLGMLDQEGDAAPNSCNPS